MKSIKHLSIVALVVLAFATFTFAAPVRGIPEKSNAATSEKTSPVNIVTVTVEDAICQSLAAEAVVSLSGCSTYSLSICKPTFTAILNTGIDRVRPAHQPPNY